jgi:hypothetical protein
VFWCQKCPNLFPHAGNAVGSKTLGFCCNRYRFEGTFECTGLLLNPKHRFGTPNRVKLAIERSDGRDLGTPNRAKLAIERSDGRDLGPQIDSNWP